LIFKKWVAPTAVPDSNDALYESHFGKRAGHYESRAAERLLQLGEEITRLRGELGYVGPSLLFEKFLTYRKRRGPNAPGEPRLAREFLDEIESS